MVCGDDGGGGISGFCASSFWPNTQGSLILLRRSRRGGGRAGWLLFSITVPVTSGIYYGVGPKSTRHCKVQVTALYTVNKINHVLLTRTPHAKIAPVCLHMLLGSRVSTWNLNNSQLLNGKSLQNKTCTHLTPLKVSTGWMSSGKFSVSGHKKLSIIGIMLHCESNAATISYT